MNGYAFLALFLVAFMFWVTYKLYHVDDELWRSWPESKPPAYPDIRNYPVAVYEPEIGVIIDFAEYHPSWLEPWRLVGDGYTVHPFAWYDMPPLPDNAMGSVLANLER